MPSPRTREAANPTSERNTTAPKTRQAATRRNNCKQRGHPWGRNLWANHLGVKAWATQPPTQAGLAAQQRSAAAARFAKIDAIWQIDRSVNRSRLGVLLQRRDRHTGQRALARLNRVRPRWALRGNVVGRHRSPWLNGFLVECVLGLAVRCSIGAGRIAGRAARSFASRGCHCLY